MKIFRNMRKRGLALFLVLTMCAGMVPAAALAADGGETCTVTFNANDKKGDLRDGKWSDGTKVKTVTVVKDGTVGDSMPVDPTDDEVQFHVVAWNTQADGSGSTFTKDTPITSDITVYASWENHLWDDGKVTAHATCIKDGVKTYTCTECGYTKGEVAGEKLGHDYGDGPRTDNCESHTDPNCTGHTKTCQRPGCTDMGHTVTEKHTYYNWDTDADGNKYQKCKYCSHRVTIKVTGSCTATYTGQNQSLPRDEVSVTANSVETKDFAIDHYEDKDRNTVTPKDAGEYFAVIKKDGEEIGRVTFTIEPAILTATYGSETINAGGKPAGSVTVTGFVGGEDADSAEGYTAPAVDLAGIDTGRAGTHTLIPSGGAAKNYTFQYKPGTLTVTDTGKSTAEAVTSYSPTYDGKPKPLPKDQVTVKVNGTPTTDFIIDHYEDGSGNRVTPKDAGTYKAVIEVTDKDGTKITTTVTYIVKPRPLTIHTASASKTYDGRPLTKTDGVTFTGLVDGETVSVTVTGSQTGVGSSDNTYTEDWENSTAKPGNYIITPDYGTLTVNEGGGGGSWPDPKPEPKPDPKPNPKPDPAPDPDPTPDPPPTPTNPQPGISDRPVAPDTGMVPYDPTIILDDLVPLAAPHLNVTDHFAYIVGYSDGLIRPQSCITRGEAATIFLRLMLDEYRRENWATENPFSDVGPETWCNNAVSTCVKAGIIQGYSDGTFRPDAPITRAEFAAIAARFVSEDVPGYDYFTDMEGHWARISVARAVMAGWIQGDGRTFRPEDKMTRAETITLVNRMINRFPDQAYLLEDMIRWKDNPEDAWYYAELQEASNSHTYDLAETAFTEIWTALLPNRDWAALEGEWAEAGSAPGGEVAPDLQEGYSGKQNDSEPSADAPS